MDSSWCPADPPAGSLPQEPGRRGLAALAVAAPGAVSALLALDLWREQLILDLALLAGAWALAGAVALVVLARARRLQVRVRASRDGEHLGRAMFERARRLSRIVESLPDALVLVDRDGRVVEVIRPERIALPVVAGRRLPDLLPADAADLLLAGIRLTLESGFGQSVEYRLPGAARDGWYEGRTAPLPVDFASRPMVMLSARNVTANHLAEEKLRQAKTLAERANAAKSQFLANMSHELRTPLNAIIGFSEIMTREPGGLGNKERTREYAGYILNSGAHLLELINDLLDMSRLEAGLYHLHEEEVDLGKLIDGALTMVGPKAEQGRLHLETQIAAGLPLVRGDRRALQQVLLSVLSNAVKFTPPTGRVTVGGGLDPDGGCRIVVRDTGVGIEAAAIGVVMEPFQQADMTTSRKFGGTGLGLAISRNLMVLHGGRLELESRVGTGTAVTIALPAHRVIKPDPPGPAGA